MSNTLVTINLVVLNGEKYIRFCLESIFAQTYSHNLIELNILDNGSNDRTKEIIRNFESEIKRTGFSKFSFIEGKNNLGMWPGQEELLKYSAGKYILAMAVDVILDKDFIKNAVTEMDSDYKIGALQARVFKYDLRGAGFSLTSVIDTCGFRIDRSRRVTNIGHGYDLASDVDLKRKDQGFSLVRKQEIFGVEGACPFFCREAIEDIRIDGEFCDHDYFWYGDDLDIAWRLNLFGWKQTYVPSVIAWHDRQTTKGMKRSVLDYLRRIPSRRSIPLKKRRLDWRNIRFTIIKNDYIINILKDLPRILARECLVLVYALIFEPGVLKEIPEFFRKLPRMLSKRRLVMKGAKISPEIIRHWFK